jgi:hypothetical protein
MIVIKKIIIVAVLFLAIYLILRIVPKTKLEDRDIFIISLVFVVAYLLFDKFVLNKNGEHMGNMPTSTMPTSTMPTSNMPTSNMPTSNMPTSMMPTSNMPKSDMPTSNMPTTQIATPVAPSVATPVAPSVAPPMERPMERPMEQLSNKMPEVQECTTCKIDIKDNKEVGKTSNDEQNMAYLYKPVRKYPSSGSRIEDGILTSEMSYTDYNTLPVGANVDSKLDDFSYTFLPPDKWYPIPPHPPICVAEKQCPVCPVSTTGTTANLKEWSEASRVTPGDQINSNYVDGKINSGR